MIPALVSSAVVRGPITSLLVVCLAGAASAGSGCAPAANAPAEIALPRPASERPSLAPPPEPAAPRIELPWWPEAELAFVSFGRPDGGAGVVLKLEKGADHDDAILAAATTNGLDRRPHVESARLGTLLGTTVFDTDTAGRSRQTTIAPDGDWLLTLTVTSPSHVDPIFRVVPDAFAPPRQRAASGHDLREWRLGKHAFAVPSSLHLTSAEWHRGRELYVITEDEQATCTRPMPEHYGKPVRTIEVRAHRVDVYQTASRSHAATVSVNDRCFVAGSDCSLIPRCTHDSEAMMNAMVAAVLVAD